MISNSYLKSLKNKTIKQLKSDFKKLHEQRKVAEEFIEECYSKAEAIQKEMVNNRGKFLKYEEMPHSYACNILADYPYSYEKCSFDCPHSIQNRLIKEKEIK